MADYVLVHGGWQGGWSFARVARLLRRVGHEVYTPTLTGLGERSHLAQARINLDTHIADIANTILWEDLSQVILVGHSFGGVVISGVADRMPERIAALVYLDALVPNNADTLYVAAAIHGSVCRPARHGGGLHGSAKACVDLRCNVAHGSGVDRF
jgi:pimeloyl-ACP methyl ester carboxylesterase